MLFANKTKYQPLIDKTVYNRDFKDSKTQQIYEDLKYKLRKQLDYNKSKIIYSLVHEKRVKDYRFVFQKMLSDLQQSSNYIIYIKKSNIFKKQYYIKCKPKNIIYERRIVNNSRKRWNNAYKYFEKQINKNPEDNFIIVKRANDRGLAEWYKTIIESDFVDNLVQVQRIFTTSGLPEFHVIINCNINININKS